MKSKILVSVLMVAGLFLASVKTNNLSAQTTKAKSGMVQTAKYACPHHPDKMSDKPGKCECGMDLVELKVPGKNPEMKSSDKNKEEMKMNDDMKKMDKAKMMPESKDMKPTNKMMKKDSVKMMKEKM
jgi:hypothetical protein